jgi:signal peptidase I
MALMTIHAGAVRSAAPIHPWRKPMLLLAVAVAAVGVWLAFAPTAVGGRASYVVTDGTSMLPHFHADGLVFTEAQGDYRIGDIVAYHNRDLHAVVLHRIVAMDGDRYIFKGDNNSFRDSYHPTKPDLVGKESLYWSGGGRYLLLFRSPIVFGLSLGLLGLFAGTAFTEKEPRERRGSHAS